VEKLSALVLDYQLDSVFLHDWFNIWQVCKKQLDEKTKGQYDALLRKNAELLEKMTAQENRMDTLTSDCKELQTRLDVLRTLNERYEKDRRIMFLGVSALSAIAFGILVCMMAMALNLL
jgi:hypothetical protein